MLRIREGQQYPIHDRVTAPHRAANGSYRLIPDRDVLTKDTFDDGKTVIKTRSFGSIFCKSKTSSFSEVKPEPRYEVLVDKIWHSQKYPF